MPSWRTPTLWELGPELGIDLQIPWIDVRESRFAGGAKGDGSDDTLAIQLAANEAIAQQGTLYFPPPKTGSAYVVTSTINLVPATGTNFVMNIQGSGKQATVIGDFTGPIFRSRGWQNSTIKGLHIQTGRSNNVTNGIVAWDIDADATYTGTGRLVFIGCQVKMGGSTSSQNHIGWRVGHSAQNLDLSHINWVTCHVTGNVDKGTNGHIAWSIECDNALTHNWQGCTALSCLKNITNVPSPGAASSIGGGAFYIHGHGGSHNGTELDLLRKADPFAVYGWRSEFANRFLNLDSTGSTSLSYAIYLSGLELAENVDNCQFNINGGASVVVDGAYIEEQGGGSAFGSSLFTLSGTGQGSLVLSGGSYRATQPLHTVSSGTWTVDAKGVLFQDASGFSTGRFISPVSAGAQKRSGLYYAQSTVSGGSAALTLNRLYLSPFIVSNPITINEANLQVTTGVATAVLRAGIYADDGSGWPAALVTELPSTFDCSATALKTIGSLSITLQPGVYWVGGVAQVAAPSVTIVGDPGDTALVMGATQNPQNAARAVQLDGVTGALPNPLGLAVASTNIGNTCPMLRLKVA